MTAKEMKNSEGVFSVKILREQKMFSRGTFSGMVDGGGVWIDFENEGEYIQSPSGLIEFHCVRCRDNLINGMMTEDAIICEKCGLEFSIEDALARI